MTGMRPTNNVKNIEWWQVSDGTKRVGYFEWWVMSNERWVMEIKWWKKGIQTPPYSLNFIGERERERERERETNCDRELKNTTPKCINPKWSLKITMIHQNKVELQERLKN